MKKQCAKCFLNKDISCFSYIINSKTGYKSVCKICTNIRSKQLRELKSPSRVIKTKVEKIKLASEKRRLKINNDPFFKFKCNVRTLLYLSFKRACKAKYKKSKRTEDMLGCTLDFFMSYISSLFSEGMNFENYGMWHLDHIIPLATATDESEIIKLNHYLNFQPLWKLDNKKKGCKF